MQELLEHIASTLNETGEEQREEISQIIEHFGEDFALALLAETLAIEANGGMMTMNGKKRRTVGGVYFFLAAERVKTQRQKNIFRRAKDNAHYRELGIDPFPAFVWNERH